MLGKAADSRSRNDAKRKGGPGKATATKETECTALAQNLVAQLENPPQDKATKQQTMAISSLVVSLESVSTLEEEETPLRQEALGPKKEE